MSEPKQVPEEVKKEAVNLEVERLEAQVMEGAVMIQELMLKTDIDSRIGLILTNALIEIQEIKGSPPIQVARTIAKKALDKSGTIIQKFYEEHYGHLVEQAVPSPGDDSGAKEHEAKHIPSRTD